MAKDVNTSLDQRTGSFILMASVFATFVSAFLVFSIQPLFTRMTLPFLGGASNVWATAMVFFQTVLLLGYIYTHFLTKFLGVRAQVIVHSCLMALAVLTLPPSLPAFAQNVPDDRPALWLLMSYSVGVGLPFLALSANAPLVQRWFSTTRHPSADDPYFLYAAANVGSLIALISYPIIFEPLMRVPTQAGFWSAGYLIATAGILGSGLMALRKPALTERRPPLVPQAPSRTMSLRDIGRIGLLAFAPSGLLLAVTTHLTTDIASIPLLWIIPFSLYLATYILVFAAPNHPLIKVCEALAAPLLLPAALVAILGIGAPLFAMFLQLVAFGVISIVCHARIARLRPPVEDLTLFYIVLSVGGVLGGIFSAIVAPLVFNDFFELPLLLALSAYLTAPLVDGNGRALGFSRRSLNFLSLGFLTLSFLILRFSAPILMPLETGVIPTLILNMLLVVAVFLVLTLRHHRAAFSISTLSLIILGYALTPALLLDGEIIVRKERSFYGVVKVSEGYGENGLYHSLINGTTIHNHQFREQGLTDEPLAYYGREGPFGELIRARREAMNGQDRALRIGVIGLGAGALACLGEAGDTFVFYEIDPVVIDFARDPELFSFLSDCDPAAEILIGDARLSLANQAGPETFDILIVDALQSGAIATHLITREAVALYRARLAPGGIIAFHTSNRNLDMVSVAIGVAKANETQALVRRYSPTPETPFAGLISPASVVALPTGAASQAALLARPGWREENANPLVGVWTDDYSHVIGAWLAKDAQDRDAQDRRYLDDGAKR